MSDESDQEEARQRVVARQRAVAAIRAVADDVEGNALNEYIVIACRADGRVQVIKGGSINADLAMALDYLARRASQRFDDTMDDAMEGAENP